MSLTLSTQPGFTEVPDNALDAGNALTAANAKAIKNDAQFAAVRDEQFVADYLNGETVPLPVSPADAYAYSRAELRYSWSLRYSGSATRDGDGNIVFGPTGGAGHMLFVNFLVNQSTGAVSCQVSYHKDGASQTNTTDGVLTVITHAQRLR